MYIGLHVTCRLLVSGFKDTTILPTNFPKNFPSTKFYETLPSGRRAVPCGRTDETKLTDAFRNLAYAPNNNGLLHLTDKTLQGFRNDCRGFNNLSHTIHFR